MGLLDNLISYWKMDEVDGTRKDSHGLNHLTDNNTVASAAGVIDNGADFEESNLDEALSIADSVDFDFTTAMSWSIWVKPETLTAAAHALISKFADGSQAAYRLRTDGSGNIICLLADQLTDNDDAGCPQGSVGGLSVGVMAHLVIIYNGAGATNADRLKIYLNNVLQTLSFTGTIPASLLDSTAALCFGLNIVGGAAEYDGIIDEVGCWNRLLTTDEISDLYNNGNGLTYPFITITNTKALDLESGSSQYASVADTAALSITGNLSIEAWINLESDKTHVLISKWDEATNRRSYSFYINTTNGKLHFVISSDGITPTDVSSNYSFFTNVNSLGTWIHVAVTYNAAAGTCKFYINGVLDSTASGLATSIHDNTSAFAIGANDTLGTPANFTDGKVNQVRVFASERSATQILADIHSESANGSAGYWKLNGNYLDSSGNNQTLTATGSPVFTTDVPFFTTGLSLEVTSTQSVYLTSNEPTVNKDGEDIFVGEHNAGVEQMRALIKYAIDSIPATATINLIVVMLTFTGDNSDSARNFNVYRLKRVWVENQATWNVYSTGNSWQTAGAAGANDRESTAINLYHAQVAAPDTTTPGRKGVILNRRAIQEMINGTFTNNGILLQVDNESNDAILYGSDDNVTASKRPQLLIDYTEAVVEGDIPPAIVPLQSTSIGRGFKISAY